MLRSGARRRAAAAAAPGSRRLLNVWDLFNKEKLEENRKKLCVRPRLACARQRSAAATLTRVPGPAETTSSDEDTSTTSGT